MSYYGPSESPIGSHKCHNALINVFNRFRVDDLGGGISLTFWERIWLSLVV